MLIHCRTTTNSYFLYILDRFDFKAGFSYKKDRSRSNLRKLFYNNIELSYFNRFNITEIARMHMRRRKEMADHYLLKCELYDEEIDALRRSVGVQGMRSSVLLGDGQMIKETVEYMNKTGRFKPDQRWLRKATYGRNHCMGKM
jgi:hypothetical protein